MSNIATKTMLTHCPYCRHTRSWLIRRSKRKCKRCRREFSVKSYPVAHIRSTPEEWQWCIAVFLRQRASRRVRQETSLPRCRVLTMLHHIRVCMTQDVPSLVRGPLELDETYIGGQRKNKRLHIRRIQAKKGHGTDKLPIVGLFDRCSSQMMVTVEPRKLDMRFILAWIGRIAVARATVYTDGYPMYRMLKRYGYDHHYVDHDGGELVRGSIHTNNMEGFWGMLKRQLGCIGGIRRARLPLFVGELVWRFNHRNLSIEQQSQRLQILISHRRFGG